MYIYPNHPHMYGINDSVALISLMVGCIDGSNFYDILCSTQTGTGKTIAFLLPGLIHIDRQPV